MKKIMMIMLLGSLCAMNFNGNAADSKKENIRAHATEQKNNLLERKRDLEQRYQQLLDERESFRQMIQNTVKLTEADHKELEKLAESLAEKSNRLKQEAEELYQDAHLKRKEEDLKILRNKTKNMSKTRPLPSKYNIKKPYKVEKPAA